MEWKEMRHASAASPLACASSILDYEIAFPLAVVDVADLIP